MRNSLMSLFAAATVWSAWPILAQDADLFRKLDANQDGSVALSEVPTEHRARFEQLLKIAGKDQADDSVRKLSLPLFQAALRAAQKAEQSAVPREARPAEEAGAIFARLDVNQDGFVTAGEVSEQQKALFERLLRTDDTNGDKQLSREEFQSGLTPDGNARQPLAGGPPGRPGGGPPPVAPRQMFERLDANQDGKLTREELPERMREGFARLDASGDGTLSLDELARGIAAGMPQPPGFARRPDVLPPGARGDALRPALAAIDANRDGELSKEEIAGAAKALLSLDRNGDGQLTRDELAAPGPGVPGRPGGLGGALRERLRQADENRDGKLSKEETPPFLRERFEQIDANRDGFLDETEMQQLGRRMP
jgi:Ca2+-binding EF-hand superfamily protein